MALPRNLSGERPVWCLSRFIAGFDDHMVPCTYGDESELWISVSFAAGSSKSWRSPLFLSPHHC
jgi:hypothetical protein